MGIETPLGAMDDCLRGEDPSVVFIGDRDRGGGKWVRVLRRMCAEVVMPGMEPEVRVESAHSFCKSQYMRNRCAIASAPAVRTLLDIHRLGSSHSP